VLGIGEQKQFGRLRYQAVVAVMAAALSLLVARLYVLQVRRHVEFKQKSESNFVQLRRISHERGTMRDREGRVLVDNRPTHDVFVTPAFLPDSRTQLRRVLGVFDLQSDARVLAEELEKAVAQKRPAPMVLRENVSADAETRTAQLLADGSWPGVELTRAGEGASRVDLVVYPLEFPSTALVFRRLGQLFEFAEGALEEIRREVDRVRGLNRFVPIVVKQNLTWEAYARASHAAGLGELPGVDVVASVGRRYREGTLASHLLGYMSEVSPQELEAPGLKGYQRGDYLGRRGLERMFEKVLRGADGQERVVVDAKGRRLNDEMARALLGDNRREEPEAGKSLVLTLDMDLQRAAESSFRGRAGAVVAVEAATGSILALASFPAYDPNLVSTRLSPAIKRALDTDPLQPWINKAIQQHYAPGSTYKVFTALAGLLEGKIGPDTFLPCPGFFSLGSTTWRCFNRLGHGGISLQKSVQVSCDAYYYRLGYQLGADTLAKHARAYGFGQRTGILLDGEISGVIADEKYYQQRFGSYQGGYVVNNAIGQGDVAVTPLQLAMAYAAVVNGGILYEPRLVLRTERSDGKILQEFPPKERKRLPQPDRGMTELMAGLADVVKPGGTAAGLAFKDDPPGLGLWVRSSGLAIGGKTGTAQVVRLSKKVQHVAAEKVDYLSRDHAWFAGVAPMEKPEIVVVALTEHGGFGGSVSAPVSASVMRAHFEKKGFLSRPEREAHKRVVAREPKPVPAEAED
jgi:penicillin-binding protein 2